MQITSTARWSTPAFRLFLLTPDHVGPAYVGWLNDPHITRYLESRFAHHDIASTRSFVTEMFNSDRNLMLGIHSTTLDRHVGNIKLGPIDRHHGLGEIGLMIGDRDAWGQGMASAVISALCRIAAGELGLRRLTAGCYASNVASRRAFERAGFTVEGQRPGHFFLDGKAEDLVLLGRIVA